MCRRICARDKSIEQGSNDDSHPHQPSRPALPLDRLARVPARHPDGPRPARVRHPSRRGLRAGQAPGHGLRDDHRPRHDRRRARDRRPPGRVHLGGADRRLQGRAPGRARALPRHHARRPRVAAGPQRRRRGLRRVPARQLDRLRAGPSVLRGGRAPHRAPPPPPRAAVPGVGDPQRVAGEGAEHARRHLHRDPRRDGSGRVGRPRGRGHRPHLHRDRTGLHSRRVSAPHPPRRGGRARRSGQRRQVGPLGDGAGRALAGPGRGRERRPTRAR